VILTQRDETSWKYWNVKNTVGSLELLPHVLWQGSNLWTAVSHGLCSVVYCTTQSALKVIGNCDNSRQGLSGILSKSHSNVWRRIGSYWSFDHKHQQTATTHSQFCSWWRLPCWNLHEMLLIPVVAIVSAPLPSERNYSHTLGLHNLRDGTLASAKC